MSRTELNVSRWLEAHCDRSAGLNTLPNNAVLADVSGDGDYRLVLVDFKTGEDVRSRLKVYKGPILRSDQILTDMPSCLISFYTDNLEPKIPAVAVACGSNLLIYKNNKPYFKYSIPPLPVNTLEQDIWKKLTEEADINVNQLIEKLKTISYHELTPRSQKLLNLLDAEKKEYIQRYNGVELKKSSIITCMSTLKKSSHDDNVVACPVLATESGEVIIVDPQSFTVLQRANVCNLLATPFILKCSGLFDVEFRVFIACREGYVCIIRRGWLEGKDILQTIAHIVDMVIIPGDKFVTVATSDKTLLCYTKRGHKLWKATMINHVTCLCLIPLKHLSTHLVAVGMKGGAIHLYQGRNPVDYISAPDTPSVITFGQFGQEEHVMIIITFGGTINFKILKRTADFNLHSQESNTNPGLQSKPLPLPKRSKLFLEQSIRERQNAIEMHQNFQQDLVRLRLRAARVLVSTISDQSGIGNEKEHIKVSAQVLGLGPKFTLILTLENMDNNKPLLGLTIIFHCKTSQYSTFPNLIKVPLVPPGLNYKVETKLTEKLNQLDSGRNEDDELKSSIRVFVIRNGQTLPVLAASISIPPTELYA